MIVTRYLAGKPVADKLLFKTIITETCIVSALQQIKNRINRDWKSAA